MCRPTSYNKIKTEGQTLATEENTKEPPKPQITRRKQQQTQENENFPHQEPRKPPSIGLSPNPPPTPNGKPIIPPKQDLTAYIDHSIDLLDALDHVPRDILRGKDFVRIIFHILVFGASRARFAIDVEFEAHVIATGLIAAVTVVQVLLV